MDGISCAASVLAIATTGVQLSIKLVSFAAQVSTAPERVTSIGNDVSLVAGLLQQLGELMREETSPNSVSIFNQAGLDTTMYSANICHRIFQDLQQAIFKASTQLRDSKKVMGGKIKLTATEKAKWPFLQPKIDILRQDLQEAKGTLMLMLQVTSLAFSKRVADIKPSGAVDLFDMESMVRTIVAIQQDQAGIKSVEADAAKSGSCEETLCASADEPSETIDKAFAPGSTGSLRLSGLGQSQHEVNSGAGGGLHRHSRTESNHSIQTKKRPLVSPSLSSDQELMKSEDTQPPESTSDTWSASTVVLPQHSQQKSDRKRLQMCLLKPTLQDYFHRIELTWKEQTINISEAALEQQVSSGNARLLETLQGLHEYEHSIIDAAVRKYGHGAHIVSAERTKTDMSTRNIVFKELPGLQFIVQGQASELRSTPLLEPDYCSKGVPLPLDPLNNSISLEDREMEAINAAAAASFASPKENHKPIKFTDCIGRKFSFPFSLCATWLGMEHLIKEAFLHIEFIGPHVAEGHYDLVNAEGQIVLPHVWEEVVEPDWTISMQLWPLAEEKEEEPAVDALPQEVVVLEEDTKAKKKEARPLNTFWSVSRYKKGKGKMGKRKKGMGKKGTATSEEEPAYNLSESGASPDHDAGFERDSIMDHAEDSYKDTVSTPRPSKTQTDRVDFSFAHNNAGNSNNFGFKVYTPKEDTITDDPEDRKVVEELLGKYTTYYDNRIMFR